MLLTQIYLPSSGARQSSAIGSTGFDVGSHQPYGRPVIRSNWRKLTLCSGPRKYIGGAGFMSTIVAPRRG